MLKLCRVCGKEFKVKPSHYDKRFCCSRACMIEDCRERMKGDSNPNYRNASDPSYVPRKLEPKKDELPPIDQIKQAYLWRGIPVQRATRKGKKKPKSRKLRCRRCNRPFAKIRDNQQYCEACVKLMLVCEQCGKSFITHRKTGTPRFCSLACARKYCGIQKRGELSNLWRGGATEEKDILRSSSEYRKWRRQVFKRDDHTCQLCLQKGGKLHAHHIKMLVGHFALAFDVANGVTLCQKCHFSIRQKEELYEEHFYAITQPRQTV